MADNHYVDNKRMYEAIVEYKQQALQAHQEGKPKPRVPEYIGYCIWMIANRLSTKPNFIRYPYREDMIGDGVENCLAYFDNFDPTKTKNPFAYFTQIIYFAFLRRIEKEKKQLYIKHKMLSNSAVLDELVECQENDKGETFTHIELQDNEYMNDIIRSFEEGIDSKKKSKKNNVGLSQFEDEMELDDAEPDMSDN